MPRACRAPGIPAGSISASGYIMLSNLITLANNLVLNHPTVGYANSLFNTEAAVDSLLNHQRRWQSLLPERKP